MTSPMEREEPLTPLGRLFVQPLMDQIINSAIAFEFPPDVAAFKAAVQSSIVMKHPRFCSLLVRDSCAGAHWIPTPVDLNRHIIISNQPLSDDPSISDEDSVNDYIADLTVSAPLATDKPLWEIHFLVAHKTVVFRVHHALGDGISLMSMLLSCSRRADDPSKFPTIGGVGSASPSRRRRKWWFVLVIWYTLVYALELCLTAMWLKDKTTVLSGGAGVELWPRKLATVRFRLEDMKIIKRGVAGATINDVLCGVISCGLSRYLNIRSPEALAEGLRFTGLTMVNLRPHTGLQNMSELIKKNSENRWGNKFGVLLLPIYHNKSIAHPLHLVMRNKEIMDKKKLSLEGPFSYRTNSLLMSTFGAKVATILNYRIVCNTTFTLSNIVGPREAISLMGNPIKHIRTTSSALPHAITMHMVSYAEFADLQILVAKDIIPDPKILARCFEDALLEMKEVVEKDDSAADHP